MAGEPGSGTWGGNVLSWLETGGAPLAVVKYEDLIADPRGVALRAVASLATGLVPNPEAHIPTFGELHAIDPEFFRRGVPRAWHDELPAELHELFWSVPENAEGMGRAGYGGDDELMQRVGLVLPAGAERRRSRRDQL